MKSYNVISPKEIYKRLVRAIQQKIPEAARTVQPAGSFAVTNTIMVELTDPVFIDLFEQVIGTALSDAMESLHTELLREHAADLASVKANAGQHISLAKSKAEIAIAEALSREINAREREREDIIDMIMSRCREFLSSPEYPKRGMTVLLLEDVIQQIKKRDQENLLPTPE